MTSIYRDCLAGSEGKEIPITTLLRLPLPTLFNIKKKDTAGWLMQPSPQENREDGGGFKTGLGYVVRLSISCMGVLMCIMCRSVYMHTSGYNSSCHHDVTITSAGHKPRASSTLGMGKPESCIVQCFVWVTLYLRPGRVSRQP